MARRGTEWNRWALTRPPSEPIGDKNRTTQRYIPEVNTLHNHRCENLKSYMLKLVSASSADTGRHSPSGLYKLFPTATRKITCRRKWREPRRQASAQCCQVSLSIIYFCDLCFLMGRAIAEAVSRWLPTAAARVQSRVWSSGICGGQSGAGAGFLWVLRFPLPFIPPNSPSSQSPGVGTIGQ
jgi:hypothetical protein